MLQVAIIAGWTQGDDGRWMRGGSGAALAMQILPGTDLPGIAPANALETSGELRILGGEGRMGWWSVEGWIKRWVGVVLLVHGGRERQGHCPTAITT